MFSIREVADDEFVYRCHECGWESEIITNEQAIIYPRSHYCEPKAVSEAKIPGPEGPIRQQKGRTERA